MVYGKLCSLTVRRRRMLEKIFGAQKVELIKDELLIQEFTPKCPSDAQGSLQETQIWKQYKNLTSMFTFLLWTKLQKIHNRHRRQREESGYDHLRDRLWCQPCSQFSVEGRNGIKLREKWELCPEWYMGAAIPTIPNYISLIGPTWPIENWFCRTFKFLY